MTTLILIRHGESEANRNGFFAGQTDARLEEKGLRQAELTAKYIKENYKVDKIYASDLKRAFNTGKCLSDLLNIEIIKNKNLREINAGKWEGVKFDDLKSLYENDYNVWLNDIGNSVCTGGESVKELSERVIGELEKICRENDGKTVAIATHATPIRALQCKIEKGSLDNMKDVPWVSNASVSVVCYNEGKWSISLISEDSHLDGLKTVFSSNV